MDVGAANKGIMTDGDQCASFSGDGPPRHLSCQAHSEGPWGGAMGPFWDQVLWVPASLPSHSLESFGLASSSLLSFLLL